MYRRGMHMTSTYPVVAIDHVYGLTYRSHLIL